MINKRLQDQLVNLKKSQKPILILEGSSYNSKISQNAIKGMLLSIAVDFQIPLIPTKDERETSEFLIILAKRQENPKSPPSIRQNKTPTTLEDQKQFILEGFPSIGPVTSKKLLKEFPSLAKIFNASKEELEKCGMNEDKIRKFKQLLA
jgi:Fanconi anemia group M protein